MKNIDNIDRDHYEQSPSTGRKELLLIMGCPHGYRQRGEE